VFGHFLTEFEATFDGEPATFPSLPSVPSEARQLPQAIREMPQVILKSADGKLSLRAGPARIDIVREDDPISDAGTADFFRLATQLGLAYLRVHQGKASRIACVLQKVLPDQAPANTLSRHFCQARWIEKPFDRPGDFELHAHKRYRLDNLFEINSWVRCKTAILAKSGQPPAAIPDLILVEQDFNSLAAETETRELSTEEIRQFFEIAPQEMRRVLELYFPEDD
jgi:hypothetical protein